MTSLSVIKFDLTTQKAKRVRPCFAFLIIFLSLLPANGANLCADAFQTQISIALNQAEALALELRSMANKAGIPFVDYLQTPTARKLTIEAAKTDATFLKRFKITVQAMLAHEKDESRAPLQKVPQKMLVKGEFVPTDVEDPFAADHIVELPDGSLIAESKMFPSKLIRPTAEPNVFATIHEFDKSVVKIRLLDQKRFVALEEVDGRQTLVFGQIQDLARHQSLRGTRSPVLIDVLQEADEKRGNIVDITPLSNGSIFTSLSDGAFRVYQPNYQHYGVEAYGPAHSAALPGTNTSYGFVRGVVELPGGDLVTANDYGIGPDKKNYLTRWNMNQKTGQYTQVPFLQSPLPDNVISLTRLKDGTIAATTFDTESVVILADDPVTRNWFVQRRIDLAKGLIYNVRELPEGHLVANTHKAGFVVIELLPQDQHLFGQTLDGHSTYSRNTMHVLSDGRILTLTNPMEYSNKVRLWERTFRELTSDPDSP